MALEIRDYISGIALAFSAGALAVAFLSYRLNYRPSIWVGGNGEPEQLVINNLGNRALFIELMYETAIYSGVETPQEGAVVDLDTQIPIEAGKSHPAKIKPANGFMADIMSVHIQYRYGSDTRIPHEWNVLLIARFGKPPVVIAQDDQDLLHHLRDTEWMRREMLSRRIDPDEIERVLTNLRLYLPEYGKTESPSPTDDPEDSKPE